MASSRAARFVPIVALLVVGVAALVLWSMRSSHPGRAAAPVASNAGSNAGNADSLALPELGEADPVTRREVKQQPKDALREMLAAPITADTVIEARFAVTDGTNGQRLQGARVAWAERREIDEYRLAKGWGPERTDGEVLARIGRELISDQSGEVDLRRLPELPVAAARHGALHAEARMIDFKRSGRWRTLEGRDVAMFYSWDELLLFPDRALEIQVLDSARKPRAGVEVCLRTDRSVLTPEFAALDRQDPAKRSAPGVREIWRGVTEGDLGLARIEHADALLLGYYDAVRNYGSAIPLDADFGFPTNPPAAVRVDPADWPVEPIQLVLPEMGALTVIVLDAGGLPTTERVRVCVDSAEALERPSLRIGEGELENGRLRLTDIPYDMPLAVNVNFYGARDPIRRQVDGPTKEKRDIELVIEESAPTPVISGRLLDPAGAPLVGAEVTFRFESKDRTGVVLAYGSRFLTIRPDGGFEVPFTTQLYEGGSVALRFESDGRSATRELARELGRLRIELGDVRLAAEH